MYSEKYKCNFEIWEGVPRIDMGGTALRGLILDKLDLEAKNFLRNSSDSEVERNLPGVFVKNEKEAHKVLLKFIDRFILKSGILFSVVLKENNIPIGYVACNSPKLKFKDRDEEIGEWSIDFWVFEKARNKGIMTAAVYNTLAYLQEMGVSTIYAFVDKENIASMEVLKKCSMSLVEDTGDGKMFKFMVRTKQ